MISIGNNYSGSSYVGTPLVKLPKFVPHHVWLLCLSFVSGIDQGKVAKWYVAVIQECDNTKIQNISLHFWHDFIWEQLFMLVICQSASVQIA